jgi:hypothetical protein
LVVLDIEYWISNLEFRIPDIESRISNLESRMILLGFRIHAIGSIYRTNIIHMTTFMSQRINIIYIKLGLAWLCAKVDVLLVLASRMREREREREMEGVGLSIILLLSAIQCLQDILTIFLLQSNAVKSISDRYEESVICDKK